MQHKLSCRFLIAAILAGAIPCRLAWAEDTSLAPSVPDGAEEPSERIEPNELPEQGEPEQGEPIGPVSPSDPVDIDGLAVDEDVDKPESSDVAGSVGRVEAGAKRLRLDDAIELALQRHPQLVAAREQSKSVEARVGQAQAQYYPRIDGWLQYLRASENGSLASFYSVPGMSRVGGSKRLRSDGSEVPGHHSFNNFLVAVSVQQMLYDFGRTKGAVEAQRAFVKAAKMNEKLVEQMVVFGVMQAFYEVRAAREAVRVAEEAHKTSLGILELAQAGHDAGLRPPSEKARAEADVAAAEVALIRANLELDMARARVANAVGAAGQAYEPADEALGSPPAAPREEESIQVALRNRPELRALDFQKEGLSQSLSSVKARQRPHINALASASSRGQFLPDGPTEQDPYQRFNWNVGVVINIPMFQGLLIRKQKEELHAEMKALDGGQEAIRQAVILEVKQALAAVRAADEAVRASRKGVEAAKVALDTSQGRYQAGLGTLIEVVDAQATYVSARSQVVQATYDRHLARAVLGLAMGKPHAASSSPAPN